MNATRSQAMHLMTGACPTARQRYDTWHIDVPCVRNIALSTTYGTPVYLCDATLGPTGSWKDFLVCLALRKAEIAGCSRIVVASSGNHGRAIAWGAAHFGMPVRVVTYDDTDQTVVDTLRSMGAEVVRYSDREQVYAALQASIDDGWFSATLTDQARLS